MIQYLLNHALEIAGFLIGLLYLWWEYHADRRMWFASVIMPAISMWIYFSRGLYADFAINIYYLVIAIYGYLAWSGIIRRRRDSGSSAGKATLPVSHMPAAQWAVCSLALAALWAAIFFFLERLTDSNVPVYDAFTTALSIVAMWMLARKYIEQWYAWIAVDAVCVGLYIYKGIYYYAALYAIYTVIAFFGYAKWHRIMMSQTQN